MENQNQQLAQISNSEIKFETNLQIKSVTDLVKLQTLSTQELQKSGLTKLSSISAVKKYGGIELSIMRAKLKKAIVDIFDYYGENISAESLEMLVEQFELLGYMLNGADLELFTTKAKRGVYKTRVDVIEGKEIVVKMFKLNANELTEWLEIYIHERRLEFEKANTFKRSAELSNGEIKALLMFKDKLKEPKELKLVEDKPIEVILSPEDQYKKDLKDKVQSIYNEFKALQVEQNSRLVEVNGKHYDYNEYLKLRTT